VKEKFSKFQVPALSVEGAFVSLEAGPPARIWIKA